MITHRPMTQKNQIRTHVLMQPEISVFSTWVMSRYGFNSAYFRPVDIFFLELLGLLPSVTPLQQDRPSQIWNTTNQILNIHRTEEIIKHFHKHTEKNMHSNLSKTVRAHFEYPNVQFSNRSLYTSASLSVPVEHLSGLKTLIQRQSNTVLFTQQQKALFLDHINSDKDFGSKITLFNVLSSPEYQNLSASDIDWTTTDYSFAKIYYSAQYKNIIAGLNNHKTRRIKGQNTALSTTSISTRLSNTLNKALYAVQDRPQNIFQNINHDAIQESTQNISLDNSSNQTHLTGVAIFENQYLSNMRFESALQILSVQNALSNEAFNTANSFNDHLLSNVLSHQRDNTLLMHLERVHTQNAYDKPYSEADKVAQVQNGKTTSQSLGTRGEQATLGVDVQSLYESIPTASKTRLQSYGSLSFSNFLLYAQAYKRVMGTDQALSNQAFSNDTLNEIHMRRDFAPAIHYLKTLENAQRHSSEQMTHLVSDFISAYVSDYISSEVISALDMAPSKAPSFTRRDPSNAHKEHGLLQNLKQQKSQTSQTDFRPARTPMTNNAHMTFNTQNVVNYDATSQNALNQKPSRAQVLNQHILNHNIMTQNEADKSTLYSDVVQNASYQKNIDIKDSSIFLQPWTTNFKDFFSGYFTKLLLKFSLNLRGSDLNFSELSVFDQHFIDEILNRSQSDLTVFSRNTVVDMFRREKSNMLMTHVTYNPSNQHKYLQENLQGALQEKLAGFIPEFSPEIVLGHKTLVDYKTTKQMTSQAKNNAPVMQSKALLSTLSHLTTHYWGNKTESLVRQTLVKLQNSAALNKTQVNRLHKLETQHELEHPSGLNKFDENRRTQNRVHQNRINQSRIDQNTVNHKEVDQYTFKQDTVVNNPFIQNAHIYESVSSKVVDNRRFQIDRLATVLQAAFERQEQEGQYSTELLRLSSQINLHKDYEVLNGPTSFSSVFEFNRWIKSRLGNWINRQMSVAFSQLENSLVGSPASTNNTGHFHRLYNARTQLSHVFNTSSAAAHHCGISNHVFKQSIQNYLSTFLSKDTFNRFIENQYSFTGNTNQVETQLSKAFITQFNHLLQLTLNRTLGIQIQSQAMIESDMGSHYDTAVLNLFNRDNDLNQASLPIREQNLLHQESLSLKRFDTRLLHMENLIKWQIEGFKSKGTPPHKILADKKVSGTYEPPSVAFKSTRSKLDKTLTPMTGIQDIDSSKPSQLKTVRLLDTAAIETTALDYSTSLTTSSVFAETRSFVEDLLRRISTLYKIRSKSLDFTQSERLYRQPDKRQAFSLIQTYDTDKVPKAFKKAQIENMNAGFDRGIEDTAEHVLNSTAWVRLITKNTQTLKEAILNQKNALQRHHGSLLKKQTSFEKKALSEKHTSATLIDQTQDFVYQTRPLDIQDGHRLRHTNAIKEQTHNPVALQVALDDRSKPKKQSTSIFDLSMQVAKKSTALSQIVHQAHQSEVNHTFTQVLSRTLETLNTLHLDTGIESFISENTRLSRPLLNTQDHEKPFKSRDRHVRPLHIPDRAQTFYLEQAHSSAYTEKQTMNQMQTLRHFARVSKEMGITKQVETKTRFSHVQSEEHEHTHVKKEEFKQTVSRLNTITQLTQTALSELENKHIRPVKKDYVSQAQMLARKMDEKPRERPMESIEINPEPFNENIGAQALPTRERPLVEEAMAGIDVDAIFEKIYQKFEKRISFEKRRRGL